MSKKAVFLDRDGTIIEDTGFPHKREHIKFLPRVAAAIRLLNEKGYKVIVVSNQSGVARGLFAEDAVKETNEFIKKELARDEAIIHSFYYCPHHIAGTVPEYAIECTCRKPEPGMLIQAASDMGIDLSKSYLVGDKASDIEAGRRAGCFTILLADTENKDIKADKTFPDLYRAAKWLAAI